VIGGTAYQGREIPWAWPIEFEPFGEEFDEANPRIMKDETEPDGYAWSAVICAQMAKEYPDSIEQLHSGDTESETCVLWVESEAACKALVQVIWKLIYGSF